VNLDALTVVVAGLAAPAVALLTYLFSRRGQLRQLNTTSDAAIVTSASTLVTQLQTQVQILTEALEKLDTRRSADRTDFANQLARSNSETSRLALLVAQLQTDLVIANGQIEAMRKRVVAHPDVTDPEVGR
jgi:uncharacterized tellurite resistance protein B-like protein